MRNAALPNKRFEPTAQMLHFWVPSALRAPATPYFYVGLHTNSCR